MAFPAVESTATTGRTAAETTSPVNYPAVISPNALIVCIARVAVAGAIGWPAGWTELVENIFDGSDDVTAIAYKTAVGDEDGTTFNVTHGNGKSAYIVYSITGATDPTSQPPELSISTIGSCTLPDPASLTPTGGAKDYLWLWLGGWEGEQTSPPVGNPTNYTNPLGASTGTGGAVTTNCRVASARRNLNAASEDPPTWTTSACDDWTAYAMAVHPSVITPVTVTDSLALATPTPAIAARFSLTEALALATPDPTIKAVLSLSEALSLATPDPGVKVFFSITDSLALAETPLVKLFKALTDGLSLADAVSVITAITKLVTDSLALATPDPGIKATLSLAEALALATPAPGVKAILLLAEGLALATPDPGVKATVPLSEALVLDTPTPTLKVYLALADGLALAETASVKAFVLLLEPLTLTELISISPKTVLLVTDTLELTAGDPLVYIKLTPAELSALLQGLQAKGFEL